MSNQTNTIQTGLTFKTAVLFRRAMTEGGLYAQMMPGVFSTAEALADGIKTHKALAREAFVYMPVDVALDDKGSPVAVEPITAKGIVSALRYMVEAGENAGWDVMSPHEGDNAVGLNMAREALAQAEGWS